MALCLCKKEFLQFSLLPPPMFFRVNMRDKWKGNLYGSQAYKSIESESAHRKSEITTLEFIWFTPTLYTTPNRDYILFIASILKHNTPLQTSNNPDIHHAYYPSKWVSFIARHLQTYNQQQHTYSIVLLLMFVLTMMMVVWGELKI